MARRPDREDKQRGGVATTAVRHICRPDFSGGHPELQEGSGLGVVAVAQGRQRALEFQCSPEL
jgi:hypothetical protein